MNLRKGELLERQKVELRIFVTIKISLVSERIGYNLLYSAIKVIGSMKKIKDKKTCVVHVLHALP